MVLLGCASESTDNRIQEVAESDIEESLDESALDKVDDIPKVQMNDKASEKSESDGASEQSETSEPIEEVAAVDDGYKMIHFDVLDVDLPYPSFVEEWGDVVIFQRSGSVHASAETGEYFSLTAFLPEDQINPMTGEPIEYNRYFFDDTDPENVLEWSDEDDFFRIHASVEGIDTFMAVYHGEDCSMTCKLMGPTEEAQTYEESFDYICEAMMNAEPNPQVISEEEIIKYVQGIYKSPCADVDHYENGYMPVIHLYEEVENPEESHIATWGWVMVNPVTGEAIDQITYESFVVTGARVEIK